MNTTPQSGFAVAAVIGIVALLAIVGGTAYVATRGDADVDTNTATTTASTTTDIATTTIRHDNFDFHPGVDANGELIGTLATTSIGADLSASTSVGGINVNLGGSAAY
jgi:hypothetical protein